MREATSETRAAGEAANPTDGPIGIFDSGFGGLTVARSIIDLLPGESLVYFGDTGRYPYGPRPAEEVRSFAIEIGDYLAGELGCKLVVVACNTAASVALAELEERLGTPVVGVIEPGMRAALKTSGSGRVGVIGTVGTIGSGAYQELAAAVAPDLDVFCAACPGFVEFVERGETDSEQVHVLAERLLAPLKAEAVDTLLLGCTHYPFLARTIGDVMGRDVTLVSSADETAFDVKALIERQGIARTAQSLPSRRWLSSGDVEWFASMGKRLLGPELERAERVELGARGS